MTFRLLAVALAAVLSLVLAACGNTLDLSDVEDTITKDAEAAGLTVEEVDCPDDIEAKEGDTFDCTVKADGEELPLTLTQKDDDGNLEYDITTLGTSAEGGGTDTETVPAE